MTSRDDPAPQRDGHTARARLRLHWPEYLMEAGELGSYMFLVCAFATLLRHPASPLQHFITSEFIRRLLFGLSVGGAVTSIAMTAWGKQSGGHFNPAVTLTFYRLGKIQAWDAFFYVSAQFLGATLGVTLATLVLRGAPGHASVRYATTSPGAYGTAVAFLAELAISFTLMATILFLSNHPTLSHLTAYAVGALYAFYITFETPLSGMSMNPARTFGSAFHAAFWHAIWVYFAAPVVGMLLAAEVFLRVRRGVGPYCAKLHHANHKRCIFLHSFEKMRIPEI